MLQTLVAELAGGLEGSEEPLHRAAELLCTHLEVDRTSISEIDLGEGRFEILASAGAGLLVRGTRLPLGTSSHFLETAGRRNWSASDFTTMPEFTRPLDEVVMAAGFGSGCAVPIVRGDQVIGAVAVSSRDTGVDYAERQQALTAVSGMLAVVLGREVSAGPRVLVCHDDALVAHGLARIIEATSSAQTLVCITVQEALDTIRDAPPDIIVCDDHVGGMRVDELVGALRQGGAGAPVLVVASHDTTENLGASVGAGAAAYILRTQASAALPLALATLRDGRTLLPPQAGVVLDGGERLTAREREVLICLEEGLRTKQVALRFGISEATAKCHTRNVFRKMRVSSRAEAVREARRQGVLA